MQATTNMSNSRERILSAIRRNKPAAGTALPELPERGEDTTEPLHRFVSTLVAIGAEVVDLADLPHPLAYVQSVYPDARRLFISPALAALSPRLADMNGNPGVNQPLSYADVDVALLPGRLGVAENGAVWLDETMLPQRVLPFITQHLVLFVAKPTIVADMHTAYTRLDDLTGFGVFVAGPSKTADIEQSLVKGAQGARTTLVILV